MTNRLQHAAIIHYPLYGIPHTSQFLIAEQSLCCVPWDDAGAFLCFSVTYLAPTEADEAALNCPCAVPVCLIKWAAAGSRLLFSGRRSPGSAVDNVPVSDPFRA